MTSRNIKSSELAQKVQVYFNTFPQKGRGVAKKEACKQMGLGYSTLNKWLSEPTRCVLSRKSFDAVKQWWLSTESSAAVNKAQELSPDQTNTKLHLQMFLPSEERYAEACCGVLKTQAQLDAEKTKKQPSAHCFSPRTGSFKRKK